jgi:hypothetical protein
MAMKLTESEKKIDNMLRSINKHLSDVFTTFGGNSAEYEKAQNEVFTKLSTLTQMKKPEYDSNGEMTKPLQLSRSRNAIAEIKMKDLQDTVRDVRERQKKEGSAKTQAQKYIKKMQAQNITPTTQNVKEYAKKLHRQDFADMYNAVTTSENIPEFEQNAFIALCKKINVNSYDYLSYVEEYGKNLLDKYEYVYQQNLGDYNDTDENAEEFDINQLQ